MTLSNTLAVVGALLAALSFLVLGGELLRPKKLLPEENQVAETLVVNHRALPPALRPSKLSLAFTVLAGLFFLLFAGIYTLQLFGAAS